jgi:hypothetical protein
MRKGTEWSTNEEVPMQAMIRQAKANLQSHKLQSALIASTLFAAATLLSLALVTLYTARGGYNRLFERTHGAHLWLYLDWWACLAWKRPLAWYTRSSPRWLPARSR